MRLYFAGAEAKIFRDILKEKGVKNILQSAYYMSYRRQPNEDGFENLLIDSGGFTARMKGTIISVEQYALYLNEFDVKYAFNLDTNDVKETLHNQKFLEKNTKTYILPVYHCSDFICEHRELLNEYMHYPYISLGGTAGAKVSDEVKDAFYCYVFSKTKDKVKVHGLGVTSVDALLKFPFYSTDSTSWLSAAQFGKWYEFEYGKLVGHTSLRVAKKQTDKAVSNPALANYEQTKYLLNSVATFQQIERYVTGVWEKRKVVWND